MWIIGISDDILADTANMFSNNEWGTIRKIKLGSELELTNRRTKQVINTTVC